MTLRFEGWPPAAVEFLRGLAADNTKAYVDARRDVYDDAVRGPMEALLAELQDEVGDAGRTAKVFRLNRDVRFSKDKRPYKEHVAAVIGSGDDGAPARYVQLSADRLFVGVGYHRLARDQVARLRGAVADDRTGEELRALLAAATAAGYAPPEPALKTAPRSYSRDHPRVDLLRLKSLTLSRDWPVGGAGDGWLHTRAALDRVRDGWAGAEPVLDWLERNVGPSEDPPTGRP